MGNPVGPPPLGEPSNLINVTDVAKQEIDPKNFGLLSWLGGIDAGIIEALALAIWLGLVKAGEAALSLFASIVDSLLALLANAFLAAQGNNTPGFYQLTAALITDLTGVDVDANGLFDRYQSRGRIAAMQATGGAFVDLLASEFAGVTQTESGGVFHVEPGTGIGGLPVKELTPEGGMNAARAFLGFAMSFAVREGNTDFFASLLPFGIGEGFKGFPQSRDVVRAVAADPQAIGFTAAMRAMPGVRILALAPGPGASAISRPAIGRPSLSRMRSRGIRRPERWSSASSGSRPGQDRRIGR